MAADGFAKITRINEMGYQRDIINGESICAGWYDIRFPDGTVEKHNVNMHSKVYSYPDMGHMQQGSDFRAYIVVDYKGCKVQLFICGLEAKKI